MLVAHHGVPRLRRITPAIFRETDQYWPYRADLRMWGVLPGQHGWDLIEVLSHHLVAENLVIEEPEGKEFREDLLESDRIAYADRRPHSLKPCIIVAAVGILRVLNLRG